MRTKYNEELQNLNLHITEMGKMIEIAIESVILALMSKDQKSADSIIKNDDLIDKKEKEIEQLCLSLLLEQQPIATDLRLITSALKMVTDMERIGDHASDIADLIKNLPDFVFNQISEIQQMATEIQEMLHGSIQAYINQDLSKAADIILHDDIVDNLYRNIKQKLIRQIQKNASKGEQIADYLLISKYFERIGDHATNIAEWAIFSITGKIQET